MKRFIKNVPPIWDGYVQAGDTVSIKFDGEIIEATCAEKTAEFSVDDAKKYFSKRGERYVPLMFRPEDYDIADWDTKVIELSISTALSNARMFKRDAALYEQSPHGNADYVNAAHFAETWEKIAETLKGEMEKRK